MIALVVTNNVWSSIASKTSLCKVSRCATSAALQARSAAIDEASKKGDKMQVHPHDSDIDTDGGTVEYSDEEADEEVVTAGDVPAAKAESSGTHHA